MVVRRSLSPVRRRGTNCRNVYSTLSTAPLFLAAYSKRSSSRSTNVCSALKALARIRCVNPRLTLHYIVHMNCTELHFAKSSVNSRIGIHVLRTNRSLNALVSVWPINTKNGPNADASDQWTRCVTWSTSSGQFRSFQFSWCSPWTLSVKIMCSELQFANSSSVQVSSCAVNKS